MRTSKPKAWTLIKAVCKTALEVTRDVEEKGDRMIVIRRGKSQMQVMLSPLQAAMLWEAMSNDEQ